MKEDIVKKYVRDLDGLEKEVKLFKQKFLNLPEEPDWDYLLPCYHESVIFFFSVIYKYLVFEELPIFSGGKGLDAWIEYEGNVMDVEFEVLSSDFPNHHTDEEKEKCKMIVCWKDNSRKKHEFWKHIDVFELRHFWERANQNAEMRE
jgi:hypothetical protein